MTGDDLLQVVRRKTATTGSLEGWRWRELKSLLVPWFDEFRSDSFMRLRSLVFGLKGCWMLKIAMILKVGGDSTPLGQRPLSVLLVVCGIWASARMKQLEGWFKSWVPSSVNSAGNCRSSVEAWYTTALDIEEVLAGAVDTQWPCFRR